MHPIVLQHCMAVSAVAVGLQSNPYATSATVRTAGKIVLASTILTSLEGLRAKVNLGSEIKEYRLRAKVNLGSEIKEY